MLNPWLAVYIIVVVPFMASYFGNLISEYLFVRELRREVPPDWPTIKRQLEEKVSREG